MFFIRSKLIITTVARVAQTLVFSLCLKVAILYNIIDNDIINLRSSRLPLYEITNYIHLQHCNVCVTDSIS